MRSRSIVIASILSQDPTQMRLAQYDDVVHALATDRSDQTLGKRILPRRARCNGFVADAHGSSAACDRNTVNPVSIADQVAWGLIPGEGFGNLPRNPFGGRVCGHVDPDKLAPSQPDNDQNVQQVKANGRNHEQVHGCNLRQMVAQEGAPALTTRAAVPCTWPRSTER